ncbi:MAG: hypothetical protein IE886_09025 [Campylobacterales bacterium]|nr:hypothetical protein [Campylobacterales bacterium]
MTLRHELHTHPELSGAEAQTTQMLKGILEAEGGNSQMIEHGALEGVKAIFGLHAYPYLPTGRSATSTG